MFITIIREALQWPDNVSHVTISYPLPLFSSFTSFLVTEWFSDIFNVWKYAILNYRLIHEYLIEKDLRGSSRGLIEGNIKSFERTSAFIAGLGFVIRVGFPVDEV